MLNWERLVAKTQEARTIDELFHLALEELGTLQRLYEVHENFACMVQRDTDRKLLVKICKDLGLDTSQPPRVVYEAFSINLKELKDRVVKIVKDLIAKMKDVANNILNGPSLEQIKAKIEANKTRIDALDKLIGGNADIAAKLTEKLEKRNKGENSVQYVQAELESLTTEFQNIGKMNANEINAIINGAKNVANATPDAAGGSTTQVAVTTTTTTSTTATTNAQATPSFQEGGQWDIAGLKAVQAASEAIVPHFNGLETINKAMTQGVNDLNGILNGLGTDDSDSPKLKAVTTAIKEIKDRHSKLTKLVRSVDKCVKKITATIDAFESAAK